MTDSKARRIAFRVVTALFLLFLLVSVGLDLLLTVVLWLPDATVLSIIDDIGPADLTHRVHEMSISVMAWALVIGVAVQLRRPERKAAAMLMALAVPVVIAIPQIIAGSFSIGDADNGPILIPVLVMAFLHPKARDLIRFSTFDRPMAGLAAVAAVPWLVFAYDQLRLQMLDAPGDLHAQGGHWTYMTSLAILVLLWTLIGASDQSGWRLPAWIAGLASVNYALHSLVFAGMASAAPAGWAVAAIAWGIVLLVLIEHRMRATRTAPKAGVEERNTSDR